MTNTEGAEDLAHQGAQLLAKLNEKVPDLVAETLENLPPRQQEAARAALRIGDRANRNGY